MSTINAQESGDAPALTPRSPDMRWVIGGSAVLVGTLIWTFWPFCDSQVRLALQEPSDWGHTLAVPFIAGYLVYLKREKLVKCGFRTTWLGLLPVIVGVGMFMFFTIGPEAWRHHNLRGGSVGVTLFGLVLLFCGWRAMLYLWLPLAYLVLFGQTISQRLMETVTFKLQDIAAVGSEIVLNVIQVDTERSGNTLRIFHNGEVIPLNIAEACSGMRMLVAFLALGVAIAVSSLKHVWQQVLLVALGIPVAIAVNVLRVVTLGLLSLKDVEFAADDFHHFVGLVWLVPAFLIYLGVLWVLRKLVVDEDEGATA